MKPLLLKSARSSDWSAGAVSVLLLVKCFVCFGNVTHLTSFNTTNTTQPGLAPFFVELFM